MGVAVDANGTTLETTTEGLGTTTEVFGCEVNDTCTTQATNVTQNRSGFQGTAGSALKTRGVYEFCTCNLLVDICDVNCCCDVDCAYEDRQVFSSCEDEVLTYDTRYCSYTKYLYVNNTPFRWDVNQNGMFCVLKRNSPPQRILQRKMPLRSVSEVEQTTRTKFSWSQHARSKQEPPLNLTKESFHYGTPIWVVSQGKLKKLQVQNRFLTDRCLMREDVMNLRSKAYECVQTVSENNELLSLRTYFQGLFVLNLTRPFNLTGYQRQKFQGCPSNICLPIVPSICDGALTKCSPIAANDTITKATCNVSRTGTTCFNLVKQLTINFSHNGSAGYTKIEALAVLENASWDSAPSLLQRVSVNFAWNGTQRNATNQLSGNPGYKIGRPVLVGMRQETNGSDRRVARNENVSVLVLPGSFLEKCSHKGVPVRFGYNTLAKCKVQSTIVPNKRLMVKNKKTIEVVNGTEVCRVIQKNLLQIWGIDNATLDNLLFGMFGNADVNNAEDWIKVFHSKSQRESTGRIYESTLACSNLIDTLRIDIYHAKVDFEHILNQEKILGVQYRFEYVNQSFPYDPKSNRVSFETDITSQIVFYDITGPKVKRYVDAPTLKVTLPYDFFYPFVRIDNGAVKLFDVGYLLVLVGIFVMVV